MPYAEVMNRKGINREAAAHFLERLDWMVSQLHLHYAPEHNDGCMSLVQRDPSVSFAVSGVFVHRAMLPPQLDVCESSSALGRPRLGAGPSGLVL